MDGGQRRTETGCRVEPAAVRHAGGERSAQHRFPCGAAGIDKGSAAAPFVPFTAPVIYEDPVLVVNGTLPPMPHTRPIAGWRVKRLSGLRIGTLQPMPHASLIAGWRLRLIRPTNQPTPAGSRDSHPYPPQNRPPADRCNPSTAAATACRGRSDGYNGH